VEEPVPTLILDPHVEEDLLEKRRAWGGDRYDEVWDGVYIMSPLPNVEHQELVINLGTAFRNAFANQPEVRVFPGVNVSDREEDWEKNYRCPDVAVVLPGSRALDRGTFLFGGPDFCVEIISEYDRTREKFDFYARAGVRELLLIDRNPWRLELYRLAGAKFKPDGVIVPDGKQVLASEVLPLSFSLLPRLNKRPQIEVYRPDTSGCWLA
jgi:Uma2 family endonuclease